MPYKQGYKKTLDPKVNRMGKISKVQTMKLAQTKQEYKAIKGVKNYTQYNAMAKQGVPKMAKGIVKTAGSRALGVAGIAAEVGYAVGTALNDRYQISKQLVDRVAPKYNNTGTKAKKRK